jgi:drug/metabolite transporter (DMT)-like permease
MIIRSTLISSKVLVAGVPTIFVLIWSTGFVGAKMGLPYAEPFTFLAIRMTIAALLTGIAAIAFRVPFPKSISNWTWIAVVGLLLHGIYLGGIFFSISRGMPAAICALIVGMQPIITAILVGPLLGESISKRQWLGLTVGISGIGIVLVPGAATANIDLISVAVSTLSLMGISLGTILQKRFIPQSDFRSVGTIQFTVASIFFIFLAYTFETRIIQWSNEFIFALSWLVLALSLGAISLMFMLIRVGAAASFASLFYLVPPVTALFAWWLFDEQLTAIALLGIGLTGLGVWLVIKQPNSSTT